ncbi:fluoride efflux transporter FluC [Rhodococcus sp. AQ5-07]|uniref:fluoride efflux transporter FluC n=1 Tax=Rhodococcus sp. AQ5-07 TaxID=2054902 RepID=UPI001E45864F|nr:CrcB family protein [Rhodococcus sp. AQ5-07]
MARRPDPAPTLPIDPDSVPREPGPGPLHVRPSAIAAVAVGGLLGAPLRYGLTLAFPISAGQFPWTTFAINVAGALLLGLLLEALTRLGEDAGWRRRVRLGVGTGVLGSFTTYSALAVDTDLLLHDHHMWSAVLYAVVSVVVGLVATTVGIALGAQVRARRPEGIR